MATREEMREALNDYVAQASKSERVLKALRSWNCIIFHSNDNGCDEIADNTARAFLFCKSS
jgi:hypothetical protein